MDHGVVFAAVATAALALVVALAKTRAVPVQERPRPPPPPVPHAEHFEVVVSPADKFKFNAAHFIAFQGFRERLHGHNYTVGVRLVGSHIQSDGYLMDYGQIKEICGKICKEELNEKFLLPMKSDVLDIQFVNGNVLLRCAVDGSEFALPQGDCALLPIVHSSTEELAVFLWERIIHDFTLQALQERGIYSMEISVAEMPHQKAVFRRAVQEFGHAVGGRMGQPKGCL